MARFNPMLLHQSAPICAILANPCSIFTRIRPIVWLVCCSIFTQRMTSRRFGCIRQIPAAAPAKDGLGRRSVVAVSTTPLRSASRIKSSKSVAKAVGEIIVFIHTTNCGFFLNLKKDNARYHKD